MVWALCLEFPVVWGLELSRKFPAKKNQIRLMLKLYVLKNELMSQMHWFDYFKVLSSCYWYRWQLTSQFMKIEVKSGLKLSSGVQIGDCLSHSREIALWTLHKEVQERKLYSHSSVTYQLLFFFFIDVELNYNVVLSTDVKQKWLRYTYIYILFIFFSILIYQLHF